MAVLTADDVIQARKSELVNEILDIEVQLKELEQKIEEMKITKQRRQMEYELIEDFDHGSVKITTTVEYGSRRQHKDRLSFEDTLKRIFDRVGRPMRVKEIIDELEKFEYQWSRYEVAHAYITRSGIVENVGKRGVYQLIRSKW